MTLDLPTPPLPDEISSAREEHAPFLFGGLDSERDGQVRLAGADRARQDQIFRRGHPRPARERVNLRGADAVKALRESMRKHRFSRAVMPATWW